MRISRWASGIFIASYLLCLAGGITGHALKLKPAGTTVGYFFVWDMFCGWQAWDVRTRIIGEDASGNFYAVEEPWGPVTPSGNVPRINHDVNNTLLSRHIKNVLDHSAHPPIDRVYVVQEIWPKQNNVPDHLWSKCFYEPRDAAVYYNLRVICDAQGNWLDSYPDWFAVQNHQAVVENPRLQRASAQSTPFDNTFFTPRAMKGQESRLFNAPEGLSTN